VKAQGSNLSPGPVCVACFTRLLFSAILLLIYLADSEGMAEGNSMNRKKRTYKRQIKINPKNIKKSLVKLEISAAKLNLRLNNLLSLIEAEERELKDISANRVKAIQKRMGKKIRELQKERKTTRTFSRLVQNAREEEKTGRRNSWTSEQISRMREMLNIGTPVSDVANALGRKISAVRQRIHSEGISLRMIKKSLSPKPKSAAKGTRRRGRRAVEMKPWEPEEIRHILGLLGSGMPLKEVALQAGRTFQQIRQKLLLEGIPLEEIRKNGVNPDVLPEENGELGRAMGVLAEGSGDEHVGEVVKPTHSDEGLQEH